MVLGAITQKTSLLGPIQGGSKCWNSKKKGFFCFFLIFTCGAIALTSELSAFLNVTQWEREGS